MGLVVGVGILVVVALTVLVIYGQRKRKEESSAAATRLGFEFDPEGATTSSLPDCEIFRRGYRRRVSNVMKGTFDGLAVRVFDYEYDERRAYSSSTVSRTDTSYFSCALFEIDADCPNLRIDYEGAIDRHVEHKDEFHVGPDEFDKFVDIRGQDEELHQRRA